MATPDRRSHAQRSLWALALRQGSSCYDPLQLRIAQRAAMAGADVSGALDALAGSDDDAIAAQAMELAVALSLWDRDGPGLGIRFADVRTVALAALAGRCSGRLSCWPWRKTPAAASDASSSTACGSCRARKSVRKVFAEIALAASAAKSDPGGPRFRPNKIRRSCAFEMPGWNGLNERRPTPAWHGLRPGAFRLPAACDARQGRALATLVDRWGGHQGTAHPSLVQPEGAQRIHRQDRRQIRPACNIPGRSRPSAGRPFRLRPVLGRPVEGRYVERRPAGRLPLRGRDQRRRSVLGEGARHSRRQHEFR